MGNISRAKTPLKRLSITFGASDRDDEVNEKFGFTVDNVVKQFKRLL